MNFERKGLDYVTSDGITSTDYNLFETVFAVNASGLSEGLGFQTSGVAGFASATSAFVGKSGATYDTNGLGSIAVVFDGDAEVYTEIGTSRLEVDFLTGDVVGEVYKSGSIGGNYDLVVVLQNGRLDGSRFDGDLGVEWTVGGTSLNTTVSDADVTGMFFGNEAEVAAGTYEADFSRSDGRQGGLVGYFEVGKTAPTPP